MTDVIAEAREYLATDYTNEDEELSKAWDLIDRLLDELDKHQKAIDDVFSLIADSEGVAGLHHNGDVAPWDSLLEGGYFESWLRSLDRVKPPSDKEV